MKAISQRTPYKVRFDLAGSNQRFRHNAGAWVPDGQPVTLPVGVRFHKDGETPITFTNPVHEATFDPTGAGLNPSGGSNGGTVYLKGATSRHKYRVTVADLTGRIKIWNGWN